MAPAFGRSKSSQHRFIRLGLVTAASLLVMTQGLAQEIKNAQGIKKVPLQAFEWIEDGNRG